MNEMEAYNMSVIKYHNRISNKYTVKNMQNYSSSRITEDPEFEQRGRVGLWLITLTRRREPQYKNANQIKPT